jgi:hypothetical protein
VRRKLRARERNAKYAHRTAGRKESISFSSEHCPLLLSQEPTPQIAVGCALGLNLHVQATVPEVRDLIGRQVNRAAERSLYCFRDHQIQIKNRRTTDAPDSAVKLRSGRGRTQAFERSRDAEPFSRECDGD